MTKSKPDEKLLKTLAALNFYHLLNPALPKFFIVENQIKFNRDPNKARLLNHSDIISPFGVFEALDLGEIPDEPCVVENGIVVSVNNPCITFVDTYLIMDKNNLPENYRIEEVMGGREGDETVDSDLEDTEQIIYKVQARDISWADCINSETIRELESEKFRDVDSTDRIFPDYKSQLMFLILPSLVLSNFCKMYEVSEKDRANLLTNQKLLWDVFKKNPDPQLLEYAKRLEKQELEGFLAHLFKFTDASGNPLVSPEKQEDITSQMELKLEEILDIKRPVSHQQKSELQTYSLAYEGLKPSYGYQPVEELNEQEQLEKELSVLNFYAFLIPPHPQFYIDNGKIKCKQTLTGHRLNESEIADVEIARWLKIKNFIRIGFIDTYLVKDGDNTPEKYLYNGTEIYKIKGENTSWANEFKGDQKKDQFAKRVRVASEAALEYSCQLMFFLLPPGVLKRYCECYNISETDENNLIKNQDILFNLFMFNSTSGLREYCQKYVKDDLQNYLVHLFKFTGPNNELLITVQQQSSVKQEMEKRLSTFSDYIFEEEEIFKDEGISAEENISKDQGISAENISKDEGISAEEDISKVQDISEKEINFIVKEIESAPIAQNWVFGMELKRVFNPNQPKSSFFTKDGKVYIRFQQIENAHALESTETIDDVGYYTNLIINKFLLKDPHENDYRVDEEGKIYKIDVDKNDNLYPRLDKNKHQRVSARMTDEYRIQDIQNLLPNFIIKKNKFYQAYFQVLLLPLPFFGDFCAQYDAFTTNSNICDLKVAFSNYAKNSPEFIQALNELELDNIFDDFQTHLLAFTNSEREQTVIRAEMTKNYGNVKEWIQQNNERLFQEREVSNQAIIKQAITICEKYEKHAESWFNINLAFPFFRKKNNDLWKTRKDFFSEIKKILNDGGDSEQKFTDATQYITDHIGELNVDKPRISIVGTIGTLLLIWLNQLSKACWGLPKTTAGKAFRDLNVTLKDFKQSPDSENTPGKLN